MYESGRNPVGAAGADDDPSSRIEWLTKTVGRATFRTCVGPDGARPPTLTPALHLEFFVSVYYKMSQHRGRRLLGRCGEGSGGAVARLVKRWFAYSVENNEDFNDYQAQE